MSYEEDKEDDQYEDIEQAAEFRRFMMRRARRTPNPINQSLMELERMGELYGVDQLEDYNDDLSDIDDLGIF